MRHAIVAVPLLVALAVVGTAAATQTAPGEPGVAVTHAWARATPGAATTGAAYLTVTDNGRPDHLVGASTPVAATATLHQSRNENGVMQMRPVPDLTLARGQSVTFVPGGYHLMLMGLRQPLRKGDRFPLTLTFAHAPPVTVEVAVAGPGATDPMPPMPGMDMGGAPK